MMPQTLIGLGLAGLVAGVCTAPALAQPLNYTLDPAHSWVHFEVLHFGTSTIRGRIGPVNGNVTLDAAAGRGEVSLAVPTATVSTGIGFFDARLREDDLLASATHPTAYFVATRFVFDGPRVASLRGEFTWRGIGQPLTLSALRYACRTDTAGTVPTEVCGGDFEGELLRSDFGATFGLPFVANRVRLVVQVEGRRPLPRRLDGTAEPRPIAADKSKLLHPARPRGAWPASAAPG